MAQKPISELSHKPGHMSEESDYILTETKLAINAVTQVLQNAASASDVHLLSRKLEETANSAASASDVHLLSRKLEETANSAVSKRDLNLVSRKLETKADQSQLDALIKDYSERVLHADDHCSHDTMVSTMITLSIKVDALKDALIQLSQRLDAGEASGNEAAVKANLK